MKRLISLAILALSMVLLSGCATVKIFSDPDLKKETGIRFYTLKPYLLVEYQAEKDNTIKTTVLYLPDLSSPQYMKIKSGLGSGEMKMTLVNSTLESYGVAVDSKLPESMAAFADILSKSAYAAQNFSGPGPDTRPVQERVTPFRLFEIIFTSSGTSLREVDL